MSDTLLTRPDFASGALTFEQYETSPQLAVAYDDLETATHIRGVPANKYLLAGLYEEHAEIVEFAADPPQYSRIGILALNGGDNLLDAYRADTEQLELHRKEFGDLLWYSTALHHRTGSTLEEATGLTSFADLDDKADLFATSTSPLKPYQNTFDTFAIAAANTLIHGSDRRPMGPALYQLLGTVAWIAKDRLDTTLADIAAGNLQKIARRQRNGNVFGSGDKR